MTEHADRPRPGGAPGPTAETDVAVADPPPEPAPGPADRRELPEAYPWLLGSLLVAAGLIHLVMAPSHLGEAALEGVGFLVAGWAQLVLAWAVLTRPARWVVQLVVLVDAVLIAAWVVSRTAGLPLGDHAGHAETVAFVDGACVAAEAAAVIVAGLVLAARRVPVPGRGLALGLPLAVLALATAAIASPSARDHAAHSHGDHAMGQGGHGDGHAGHGGEAAGDDRGLSLLSNGHQHATAEEVELDDDTAAELEEQLALTQDLVERYPTIADAEAAGYTRAGPFAPGLGTHYQGPDIVLNDDGDMDPEDIARPFLIYDGLEPTSSLAGFMYLAYGEEEPAGFAGPNDHWHYHTAVCIVTRDDGTIDTPFGADLPDVTEEMCTDAGGQMIEVTGYMVHVWTVPGYESERGTFGELNPRITCPDGTYYMVPVEDLGTRDSACRGA